MAWGTREGRQLRWREVVGALLTLSLVVLVGVACGEKKQAAASPTPSVEAAASPTGVVVVLPSPTGIAPPPSKTEVPTVSQPTSVAPTPTSPQPSATPVPPTATAPPPPPVFVPSPTPPCQVVPIRGFGQVWVENAAARSYVGCPSYPRDERGVALEAQRLEHGVLFWTDSDNWWDKGYVFVLFEDDNTFVKVSDTWSSGALEPAPLTPPAGLYEPRGRLGKAWREGAGVRSRLGWAVEPAKTGTGAWQAFARGFMYWIPYKQGTPQDMEDRWIYVLASFYVCPPCGQRSDWLKYRDTWVE